MTESPDTRPDGGVLRDPSDEDDENREISLDIDFPDDTLFTLEEYLEMYRVASSEPAFSVLTALSQEERLSAKELSMLLDREGNDLHYHLRKLKRAALIRNRRDPNTGTEKPYSYYTLTELGHTVLTEGLETGIRKLAEKEATISEKYSG
jgi:DNA-binding MarR family transcriptional regulator